jgi:hypothetical protein
MTPAEMGRYEQEWGRPQSLEQEIKEVEALIHDWKRRGGNIAYLTPVLGALRDQLAKSQGKVASAPEPEEGIVRLASLEEVPEGFTSVGSGFYRQGHAIWELRGAEDEDGGYVLARRREERAVDMRPVVSTSATSEVRQAVSRCASCLLAGTPAMLIKQGQIVPVIVIETKGDEAKVEDEKGEQSMAPLDMLLDALGGALGGAPSEPAAPSLPELIVSDMTVQDPHGLLQQPAPMSMGGMGGPMMSPMDMAVPMAGPAPAAQPAGMAGCDCDRGCTCPCHNGKSVKKGPVQGMEPALEPSSKDPDAEVADSRGSPQSEESSPQSSPPSEERTEKTPAPPSEMEKEGAIKRAFFMRAYGPEESWGDRVIAKNRFAPQYMGGRAVIDPTQNIVYSVGQSSRADSNKDRALGVPNPILPYPNAKSGECALNDRIPLTPHGGGEPIFVSPLELERNFAPVVGKQADQASEALTEDIEPTMISTMPQPPAGAPMRKAPSRGSDPANWATQVGPAATEQTEHMPSPIDLERERAEQQEAKDRAYLLEEPEINWETPGYQHSVNRKQRRMTQTPPLHSMPMAHPPVGPTQNTGIGRPPSRK